MSINTLQSSSTNSRLFSPFLIPNAIAAAALIASQGPIVCSAGSTSLFGFEASSPSAEVSYELPPSYRSSTYLGFFETSTVEAEQIKTLAVFAHKISDSSKSIDPEIGDFINKNYWNFI